MPGQRFACSGQLPVRRQPAATRRGGNGGEARASALAALPDLGSRVLSASAVVAYVAGVLVSLLLLGGCAQWYPEKWVFWGQVVDAETQAPIQGALFSVLWYQRPVVAMDGPRYLETAVETVTDSHGDFRLEGVRPRNWNPLRYRDRYPGIILLAAGYKPVVYHNFGLKITEDAHARHGWRLAEMPKTFQGDVTKLSKAIIREKSVYFAKGSEYDLSALGLSGESGRVALTRLPRLLEVVDLQRAVLGLPQYPPPTAPVQRGR